MTSPVRIACFGDSLTEGYGLRPGQALPAVLERLLDEEGMRTRCLNFGVSGDTASDGLRRIDTVLKAVPDAAVVAFGANDCFQGDPVPLVRATLGRIIKTLLDRSIPVLLVGITAALNPDAEYRRAFYPIFTSLAAEHALDLFPDILVSYSGNPALTLPDGLHPSASGVEAIARDLLPQVRQLALSAR
ncbi:MAG: arylesterase [Proteobacteria bacterium]|nr:arylesterase [Pseudomonadota bacterium]